MEQMHEIGFGRIADGSIRLEQQSGHDERDVIHLHPEQLQFIARRMAGMKPDAAGNVAELERRIAVLTDKLQDIVCNKAFRTDLVGCLGGGLEYMAKLDGLLDLAMEFDGGRLEPEYKEAAASGNDDSTPPSADINQAQKTQHKAITPALDQLGLDV